MLTVRCLDTSWAKGLTLSLQASRQSLHCCLHIPWYDSSSTCNGPSYGPNSCVLACVYTALRRAYRKSFTSWLNLQFFPNLQVFSR